jgi:DNA-binding NarL/FixJ family response regulator
MTPTEAVARLTTSQQRILVLYSEGKLRKQVAAEMDISPRNLDGRRNAILKKLGVRNKIQAVVIAAKGGLV